MPVPTIAELKNIIALQDLPDEHLQWIQERAEYVEANDGDVIAKTGDAIDVMWFLLEGKVAFYMDVNGRLVHYFNFENDQVTGGAGGLLPYSRMKSSPGYGYAVGKIRSIRLHKKYFQELEQLNPAFIQKLIGYMTERARHFATMQLQQEKVSALGKLSAGIAHELNNPASAIARNASELNKRLNQNYELTEKLLLHQLNPEHIKEIQKMVAEKSSKSKTEKKLTALQKMQLDDEIFSWLHESGMDDAGVASQSFSEAGFSINDFDIIKKNVGKDALNDVIHWLENLVTSERILKDTGEASSRISKLVTAIKSHVHMDRTSDLEKTDIHNNIENTITLLGYKLREKNIKVKREFAENIPEVQAYVGELNQVWTNLIDNAIYAMEKGGELIVKTCFQNNDVKVFVIDNGEGISPQNISRIFEPFFTTKKVGEGSGIGLDLVNRIVKKHNGDIKVNSVPGRTEFTVCIPACQPKNPAPLIKNN